VLQVLVKSSLWWFLCNAYLVRSSETYQFNLTPSDVAAAIRSQNAQVAVGQLGGAPAVQGQVLNATVNAQSMLQTPEQFRNIFLKTLLMAHKFV
jgi:multidrug efflux pump subunit AcrB